MALLRGCGWTRPILTRLLLSNQSIARQTLASICGAYQTNGVDEFDSRQTSDVQAQIVLFCDHIEAQVSLFAAGGHQGHPHRHNGRLRGRHLGCHEAEVSLGAL